MTLIDATILGIVEGLSEFLPISSTGHLILASELLKISQSENHKVFEVTIQLGAMLAVLVIYLRKLINRSDLSLKLIAAFIPTGILGFLLYKLVKSFFQPALVSYMLIIGGIAFIIVERYVKNRPQTVTSLHDLSFKQAVLIGTIQSVSMVPGVSRSGATILGGLLLGLNRAVAAEFSFLLALPTMFFATLYDIYKNHAAFSLGDWQNFLTGFIVSFIFGVIGIKLLLRFISSYTFIPFGIYRIAAGFLFILLLP